MQLSFALNNHSCDEPEHLALPDAEVLLYHDCYPQAQADRLLKQLLETIPWQQDSLSFGGKTVPVPRLQAWFGDSTSTYAYSGLHLEPLPWSSLLQGIRQRMETIAKHEFNSVLVNYYRNGSDSVAWHRDNEKELGPDPVIASLSFGATRRFDLKHRRGKFPLIHCALHHGSLLVMAHGLQENWLHRIPKQPEVNGPRINLTFRRILRID